MKVVDANVLIYAVNEDAPQHEPARLWLDGALGSNEAVGFAWIVVLAFLRLTTRAGLSSRPLGLAQAVEIVEGWLNQPPVSDAHLAALALEHGAQVVSFDSDFGRFNGLRWLCPPAI